MEAPAAAVGRLVSFGVEMSTHPVNPRRERNPVLYALHCEYCGHSFDATRPHAAVRLAGADTSTPEARLGLLVAEDDLDPQERRRLWEIFEGAHAGRAGLFGAPIRGGFSLSARPLPELSSVRRAQDFELVIVPSGMGVRKEFDPELDRFVRDEVESLHGNAVRTARERGRR